MSLSRILTDFKGHFSYLKFCKIACFKNIACILSGCAYFQAVILLHKLYVYFYGAMLCIRGTSHGPVSVCVCVCLSQVGVLLKRLNVGSHKQLHAIAQGL